MGVFPRKSVKYISLVGSICNQLETTKITIHVLRPLERLIPYFIALLLLITIVIVNLKLCITKLGT